MQAASLLDGFSFDLFPPFKNGLTAPEVDVSRRQVVQALVISTVVVVPDELLDALFELSCAAALARARRRGDRMTRLTWSFRHAAAPRDGPIVAKFSYPRLAKLEKISITTAYTLWG